MMTHPAQQAQQDETTRAEAENAARCETAYLVDDFPEGLSVLRIILDHIEKAGNVDPACCSAGEDCADLATLAEWVLTRIDNDLADLRKAAMAAGWLQR